MKKKYFTAALIVLAVVLVITACASNVTEKRQALDTEEKNESIEPKEGGTLRIAVTRFTTLNPIYNSNPSLFQLHHLIYESLVTFNQKSDIQPLLAESWKIAEDDQSIDMTLRKGVTWHDGKPFSAEDVIFTINLIKGNIREADNPSVFSASLQTISDVQEIEPGVLRVNFSRPFGNALEIMTFPILPKHIFTDTNDGRVNMDNFEMIGTGPFKLKDYDNNRKIILEKNNNYWRKKPFINEIEVVVVPSKEAQLYLFENGDIDLAQPVAVDWAKYADDKNVQVYEYVSNHYEFLGFNFRNRLLQDRNLRQALAYSIDRHKLIKNIYLNHGTVTDHPINPSSWLFDENSVRYGYDVSLANKILEENGYLLSSAAKIRTDENNTPLKFRLITNKDNALREKTAAFIKNEFSKIGVEIEVQLLEWEELQQRINNRDFDIILGGWELSVIPDLSFAFHSSNIGGTNFISYQDETMDDLLQKALSEGDREEKRKIYRELQKHIAEEVPYISLFFKNGAIVVRDHIKGSKQPSYYNLFRGIEEWHIYHEQS